MLCIKGREAKGNSLCALWFRAASVETLETSLPLSSDTLPDDDREARAAQSQQEQHQVATVQPLPIDTQQPCQCQNRLPFVCMLGT